MRVSNNTYGCFPKCMFDATDPYRINYPYQVTLQLRQNSGVAKGLGGVRQLLDVNPTACRFPFCRLWLQPHWRQPIYLFRHCSLGSRQLIAKQHADAQQANDLNSDAASKDKHHSEFREPTTATRSLPSSSSTSFQSSGSHLSLEQTNELYVHWLSGLQGEPWWIARSIGFGENGLRMPQGEWLMLLCFNVYDIYMTI